MATAGRSGSERTLGWRSEKQVAAGEAAAAGAAGKAELLWMADGKPGEPSGRLNNNPGCFFLQINNLAKINKPARFFKCPQGSPSTLWATVCYLLRRKLHFTIVHAIAWTY